MTTVTVDGDLERFRTRVRNFFSEWENDDSFIEHDSSFYAALATQQLLGLQWPEVYGGQGSTDLHAAIMFEEAGRSRAPILGASLGAMLGSALIETDSELAREYLPKITSGEVLFCLGYTEPEAGSDLTSLQTRAVPTGDGWKLKGTKVFTSLISDATHMFAAARTGAPESGAGGISVFIVPLNTPGVNIDQMRTLEGKPVGVVALDDVVVPGTALVHRVNEGWSVLQSALAHERVGMVSLRLGEAQWVFDRLILSSNSSLAIGDAEIGRLAARLETSRAFVHSIAQEGTDGAAAAMVKLFITRLYDDIAQLALTAVAAHGTHQEQAIAAQIRIRGVRFSVTGGTSEIQRTVVAKNALTLPASRRRKE